MRTEQTALVEAIQSVQESTEIQLVKRLVRSMLEDTKDQLVRADAGEIARVQGKAQAFAQLLTTMERQRIKPLERE